MTDSKINITSSALEKGIEAVSAFLQKLVGPPIEEMGLLMADRVRYRRVKQQLRLLQRVKEEVAEKHIDVREVSLKALVPLLEGASLIDDDEEDIFNMWANLLLNYADSSKVRMATVYPMILQQMSREEAQALQKIGEAVTDLSGWTRFGNTLGVSDFEIANLERLGLIATYTRKENAVFGKITSYMLSPDSVQSPSVTAKLTTFGRGFLDAVTREEN